jgi:glyoxylase-like metal-dependent hydrolase (beta-lactamase superfamily II)
LELLIFDNLVSLHPKKTNMHHTLDLHFQGYNEAIAAFLIESSAGPILIETGPYSTFDALRKGLRTYGYAPEDIKHVLLTHIHFDHAGAAWALASMGAQVYVHPFGKGHLHDPTKLVASATMIYGDQMDTLWGEMRAIPEELLMTPDHEEPVVIGERKFTALHTPGHARHHIAWQLADTIFSGDVAGAKIDGGPVVPPCPPPDINLEDWNASIDLILKRKPSTLVLTHFGAESNVENHMADLKRMLNDWAYWMRDKWEMALSQEEITPQFMEYTNAQLSTAGVSEQGLKQYEAANPAWMSVAGLIRYWKKKLS